MTNLLYLPVRRRFGAILSALVLVVVALLELYSVLAIALDRQPLHRPWWETCGITLAWTMLAVLLMGSGLLTFKSVKIGFALVITNLIVFYCIVIFEIFNYRGTDQATCELVAIYFAVLLVGIFAAVNLRSLALRQIVGV